MWLSLIKNILLVLLLLTLQLSLIPNLPGELSKLNIILVFLVFIAIAYNFYLSTVYGFILGLFSDIYSILPFGALLIALLLSVFITYKIYENLLTNKSYYTMIGLMTAATFCYSFLLLIYDITYKIIWLNQTVVIRESLTIWSNNFIWQLLTNLIAVTLIFFTFHYFSRKFKTVFIDTTKG